MLNRCMYKVKFTVKYVSDKMNIAQSIMSISIAERRELYPTAPVSPSLLPVTLS